MLDQFFILLLLLISAHVTDGLRNQQNMWKWITAYWMVLTLKNFVNFATV